MPTLAPPKAKQPEVKAKKRTTTTPSRKLTVKELERLATPVNMGDWHCYTKDTGDHICTEHPSELEGDG